ncbi:MAG TPA: hypothetical protein GXZ43_02930 [Clostridiaceae bacterium]|nr:hypothetical protein [Clostridiaceae bacterium]
MQLEKCPYCGNEMEKGSLPNETHPYWLPADIKATPLRYVVPKSGVKLKLEDSTFFEYHKTTAYYCSNCKIIIAETYD